MVFISLGRNLLWVFKYLAKLPPPFTLLQGKIVFACDFLGHYIIVTSPKVQDTLALLMPRSTLAALNLKPNLIKNTED